MRGAAWTAWTAWALALLVAVLRALPSAGSTRFAVGAALAAAALLLATVGVARRGERTLDAAALATLAGIAALSPSVKGLAAQAAVVALLAVPTAAWALLGLEARSKGQQRVLSYGAARIPLLVLVAAALGLLALQAPRLAGGLVSARWADSLDVSSTAMLALVAFAALAVAVALVTLRAAAGSRAEPEGPAP